ncbi:MAG: type II 3-dehydroquinate dehydratase [Clostridia bacterium]|nr:type II 3-dehydroquinate dehydratase [Clostridia bacterium]
MKIIVINGPNLNMLGIREPSHYGSESYRDLIAKIKQYARTQGVKVAFYQSNHEGDLIDCIQHAYRRYDGIVINPGGYTHTSVALADAVRAVSLPCVEVHISHVNEREEYRKISYIREACIDVISGLGTDGYLRAIDRLNAYAKEGIV